MNVWGFSCRALLYISLQDKKDDGQLQENCPIELKNLMEDMEKDPRCKDDKYQGSGKNKEFKKPDK
jgi:hypothetical protein